MKKLLKDKFKNFNKIKAFFRRDTFADLEQNLQSIMGLGSANRKQSTNQGPSNPIAGVVEAEDMIPVTSAANLATTNSRFVVSAINDPRAVPDLRPTQLTLEGQGK